MELLYLLPDGVSPNGKYALAAYTEKPQTKDNLNEVSLYFTNVGKEGSDVPKPILDIARVTVVEDEIDLSFVTPLYVAFDLECARR